MTELARPSPAPIISSGDARCLALASSGREVVGLAEALYLRLLVIALVGVEITCALVIAAATVRTHDADFVRTAVLALAMAVAAGLVLRRPSRGYLAMRRWPALSLAAPLVALVALVLDGVSHSPISFLAAVSIAFPAFVCGRQWALSAATLISVGAITTAALRTGLAAVNSVGQGAIAYFVWALVLAGLAERFVQLTMRLSQPDAPTRLAAPVAVPNLAGDACSVARRQPATRAPPLRSHGSRLTARQLEVVALLADGLSAADIAARLGIATSTVYRFVERAKERTGVTSRNELVALAIREGLVASAGSSV